MNIREFRRSRETVTCTPEEYIELFDECEREGMVPSRYATETRSEAQYCPQDYPYFLWADTPDVLYAGKGNECDHYKTRSFAEVFPDHKPPYEIDKTMFGQLIGEMQ